MATSSIKADSREGSKLEILSIFGLVERGGVKLEVTLLAIGSLRFCLRASSRFCLRGAIVSRKSMVNILTAALVRLSFARLIVNWAPGWDFLAGQS